MKAKKTKTMDELTKGFEAFIKGKETNHNNRQAFENTIKKALIKKPRGSK